MRSITFLALLLTLLLSAFAAPALAADETINDDVLYDQVRLKIANDRAIGGEKIEVFVKDGNVEITGKVRTEKNRERAEKVVKKVKGVKTVVNKLQVSPV